ncbi:MAG: hypothetical protein ACXVP5_05165 [Tumebacillaceae bacterium]
MKKRAWLIILILLAWIGTDLTLWFTDQVPFSNRAYRVMSGAPAEHLNGELLMFHKKETAQDNEILYYKNSDESDKLYKAQGVPDQQFPPYFFVRGSGQEVYKYSIPNAPFRMW